MYWARRRASSIASSMPLNLCVSCGRPERRRLTTRPRYSLDLPDQPRVPLEIRDAGGDARTRERTSASTPVRPPPHAAPRTHTPRTRAPDQTTALAPYLHSRHVPPPPTRPPPLCREIFFFVLPRRPRPGHLNNPPRRSHSPAERLPRARAPPPSHPRSPPRLLHQPRRPDVDDGDAHAGREEQDPQDARGQAVGSRRSPRSSRRPSRPSSSLRPPRRAAALRPRPRATRRRADPLSAPARSGGALGLHDVLRRPPRHRRAGSSARGRRPTCPKVLGERWAAQEDREKWERQAAKDKARHESEMAAYNQALEEERAAASAAAEAAAAGPQSARRSARRSGSSCRSRPPSARRSRRRRRSNASSRRPRSRSPRRTRRSRRTSRRRRTGGSTSSSASRRSSHFGLLKEGEKPKKKGRKTEKEEDDEMMAEAPKEEGALEEKVRVTAQPTLINAEFGNMRRAPGGRLNWLANLYQNGINGILADEMGLGKTLRRSRSTRRGCIEKGLEGRSSSRRRSRRSTTGRASSRTGRRCASTCSSSTATKRSANR